MSWMIPLLIVLGIIVGYLAIGCTLARVTRSAILRVSMTEKETNGWCDCCYSTTDRKTFPTIDRSRAVKLTWGMILGWPISSWAYLISWSVEDAADRADPDMLAKQDRRIKALEKELGITP